MNSVSLVGKLQGNFQEYRLPKEMDFNPVFQAYISEVAFKRDTISGGG